MFYTNIGNPQNKSKETEEINNAFREKKKTK